MQLKSLFSKLLLSSLVFTSIIPNTFALAPVEDNEKPNRDCIFEEPEERVYDLDLISVRSKRQLDAGEEFEVKAFFHNSGNVPLRSEDSPCPGMKTYLGTDQEKDRASVLYGNDLDGWAGSNRIKMDQDQVMPGEIASFTFTARAGALETVYKEYFTPVIEGVKWVEDAGFQLELIVGNPGESAKVVREKMSYASRSGDVLTMIDLNAPKKLLVDLSDQTMEVYLGENMIRKELVSSGGPGYQTPTGTHKILGKNEVRIGGAKPHYIMPRFQMLGINGRGFTGYGIHALPSLGSASLRAEIRKRMRDGEKVPTELYYGDSLWNEAVDHLGRAVSHGCIRTAPEVADFLFNFTEIGETEVVVQY